MPRPVNLNSTVKPGERVPPEDLGQVRFAMSRLGLFDPARDTSGEESLMGDGLRRALGAFQAGQGLHEDATLQPGGPTERRLNLLLAQDRCLKVGDRNDARVLDRQRTPGALVGRVGPGLENHPDDVAAVGTVLRQLGVLKPGTPKPTKTGPVFGGLMSLQRQNGLKRDATVVPGGPTEQFLVQQLSARPADPRGTGTPTPLISAAAAAPQNRPTDPSGASPPTERQRPGFVHPLARQSQQRQRQGGEAADSPQLNAEQREAQRQDALRMLDRVVQLERGEPLDTSSDDARTAFRLRKFVEGSPEQRAETRASLRERSAPEPDSQGNQDTVGPHLNRGQRDALRILRGTEKIDQDLEIDTSQDHFGTAFILQRYANLSPEERARERDFYVQQTELGPDELARALEDPAPSQTFQQIEVRPQAGPEFLEMFKAFKEGEPEAMTKLNIELARILVPARNKDNSSIEDDSQQNVGAFIQSLVELDGGESLGRELGFHAQQVNLALDVTADSPEEAVRHLAPNLIREAPIGPIHPRLAPSTVTR